jgi:hypothetical protein
MVLVESFGEELRALFVLTSFNESSIDKIPPAS